MLLRFILCIEILLCIDFVTEYHRNRTGWNYGLRALKSTNHSTSQYLVVTYANFILRRNTLVWAARKKYCHILRHQHYLEQIRGYLTVSIFPLVFKKWEWFVELSLNRTQSYNPPCAKTSNAFVQPGSFDKALQRLQSSHGGRETNDGK